MHSPLYFNGRYTTTAERVIGVEDRGFQFGDGIYEVIKFIRKRPLLAAEHLAAKPLCWTRRGTPAASGSGALCSRYSPSAEFG